VDDDGTVVFEGTAILIYLADRFPETRLGPGVGDPQRGDFLKWMAYMTNTLQIAMQIYFVPDKFTVSTAGHDDISAKNNERLDESWRLIDGACASPGPYLLGETFSDRRYSASCRTTVPVGAPITRITRDLPEAHSPMRKLCRRHPIRWSTS
jgi:glutathione S-transferase